MRWTRSVARRAALTRTAKSCGPDAPTLASSLQVVTFRRWWQESPVTEESAKETVKTTAQGMPVDGGVPVVTTLVCFFISHARLRVRTAHPAFPAPSHFRGCLQHLGRSLRGENEQASLHIGAK